MVVNIIKFLQAWLPASDIQAVAPHIRPEHTSGSSQSPDFIHQKCCGTGSVWFLLFRDSLPVFRIRIQIRRIRIFLCLPVPHLDPFDRDTDLKIRIRIRIRTKISRIHNTDGDYGTIVSSSGYSLRRFSKPHVFLNHYGVGFQTTRSRGWHWQITRGLYFGRKRIFIPPPPLGNLYFFPKKTAWFSRNIADDKIA